MYKSFLFLFLLIFPIKAHCSSPWEGEWEIGRYYNYSGGNLTIKNCQKGVCDFDIKTYNGAHMCGVDGQMKINGKTAQYHESMKISEDEKAEESTVNFQIDEEKNIITVKCEGYCIYYCGMQGYFEGEYENANNPLRYKTSFDCWKNGLSDAEKTICATESIATADIEMNKKYEKSITPEWKQKRNNCKKDVDCLWNFYVKSIKSEYEKTNQKTLNLYEYLGGFEEDELYYPTEFTLLNDYFLNNMEKEDYEEWSLAFSKIFLSDNECDNCYFYKYGVAGLFTIVESAFYINQDEIWIAFLHRDYEHKEDEYIIIYAPKNKIINDIPSQFNKWLERLKPHYPNGIKLKHFSS